MATYKHGSAYATEDEAPMTARSHARVPGKRSRVATLPREHGNGATSNSRPTGPHPQRDIGPVDSQTTEQWMDAALRGTDVVPETRTPAGKNGSRESSTGDTATRSDDSKYGHSGVQGNDPILASVGTAGVNDKADVITVQRLIRSRGYEQVLVTGECDTTLSKAIADFQTRVCQSRRPDGRVDANGPTWYSLVAGRKVTRAERRALKVEEYTSLLQEAAARYGMRVDQLKAIMAVESGGDPNATSGSAYGLMQLTKDTWVHLQQKHPELKPYVFNKYWHDPRINILFGAAALAEKSKAVGISPEDQNFAAVAVTAYNAGQGTVIEAINLAKRAKSPNPHVDFIKPEYMKPAIRKFKEVYGYYYDGKGAHRNKGKGNERITIAVNLKYREVANYVPQVENYLEIQKQLQSTVVEKGGPTGVEESSENPKTTEGEGEGKGDGKIEDIPPKRDKETEKDAATPAEDYNQRDTFSHVMAGRVDLKYGIRAPKMNDKAEHLLKSILASCGIYGATVNSTRRTYHDQARITMNQTYKKNPGNVSRWYGDDVLRACKRYKGDISAFAKWWEERDNRRGKVSSRHLSNQALDVIPARKRAAFAAKVSSLIPVSGSGVRRIIPMGTLGEPVDHVEFTFPICS